MTKEQLENKLEYLQRMQKPLGHSSWWYTNRGSEDCINVKIYATPKDIKPLLTKKEANLIKLLNINTEDFINELYWQEVENAREFFLENLNDTITNKNCLVNSLDYGGRSGGWLCVVYEFKRLYELEDILNEDKITTKMISTANDIIKEAEQFISDITQEVLKQKKILCTHLASEDFIKYAHERLQETLQDRVETQAEKAHSLISILNEA